MRDFNLGIATIAAGIRLGTTAFGWTSCRHPSTVHRSTIKLHSSSLSQEQDQCQEQQQQQHPHSKLWSAIIESSPNTYVSPSIELAIRPPSEGGTGVVAVDDVTADSVAMCLPLDEVGIIDAAYILDSYDEVEGKDEVLKMLKDMWNKELASTRSRQESEEGKRLAVLAGIIAHLQLNRYKDITPSTSDAINEGYAFDQSRRLGLFLDAMPLLPQHDGGSNNNQHPFPTHFLYWSDDEIEILLKGTMGQTRAREVRAGIGLVVREWSSAFLKEHSNGVVTQTQILNAIFSAFSAVMSRSYGDAAGRDLDGQGRMLVPLVDMLNHDGEEPNVSWKWHVEVGDEDQIVEGKGDIAVTTLCDIKKGGELLKCYGWRPAWDIASSYGFVPRLKKERWECAIIPIFPAVLDLVPDEIPTPNEKARDETSLDLLLETNYGPLVKAVIAAVNAANEIEARQRSDSLKNDNETMDGADTDMPDRLNCFEVVSLFRPPPSAADEFVFPRRQPCVVVGTKIQSSDFDGNNHHNHRHAIELILPGFRAAASAIYQLRYNHQSSSIADYPPIEASQMAIAAASLDKNTNWDKLALKMIQDGIKDRMQTLVADGEAADSWLAQQNDTKGTDDQNNREHRQSRAGVARDVREAELNVLRVLQKTAIEMM